MAMVITGEATRRDLRFAMEKIPKKFANLMREELPEIVHLKDPSGIIWHIELKNTADGASFQSGWKDFTVVAHHLAENDLLLFEYDGNSCFRVKILEGSGCEKAHSHCLKIKISLKRGMSEDSDEVLDVTPCRKVNVSSSSATLMMIYYMDNVFQVLARFQEIKENQIKIRGLSQKVGR